MLLALALAATMSFTPAATPSASRTPTATPTITPPSVTYQTPGPQPTPIGSLTVTTVSPTHGLPVTFTEMEPNVQVLVNGNFIGNTNAAGSFTITFPTAGAYTINVGDYPQQTLVVN